MSDEKPTRVTVEFEPGTEPMSGRMLDEGGCSRPFSGWLGLAAAFGSVLQKEPTSHPEQSTPSTSARAGTGPADVI